VAPTAAAVFNGAGVWPGWLTDGCAAGEPAGLDTSTPDAAVAIKPPARAPNRNPRIIGQ
jgi:hypothetical protein